MRNAVVLPFALSLALTSSAFADGIEVKNKPVATAIASVLDANSIDINSTDLILRGSVERKGKRFRLVVEVVGPDGVVRKHRFAGKSKRALAKNVEAQLWSKLGEAISAVVSAKETEAVEVPVAEASEELPEDEPAEAPPQKSAEPEPEPPTVDEPVDPVPVLEGQDVDGPTAVYLQIGGGVFNRNLSYKDDLFGEMTGYDLGAAPVMQVRASWYPGAQLGKRGALANLGLEVQYEAPFGLDTDGLDGESYPTQAFAWGASALYRASLANWSFLGGLGYGMRTFQISDSAMGEARPNVPNTTYQQLGAHVGVRSPSVADISLEVRGGVHHILSTGDIGGSAWFPQSSANGALGELIVAYALGEQIGVFVGASMLQQGFDLAPEPGDANVAGGALDRYFSATMGLRYAGN